MPRPHRPSDDNRTKRSVANRIAEQIGPCPDLTQSDIDEIKDEGGGYTLFRAAEPSGAVQARVAARVAAVRERAIAAGEVGRDYVEGRLEFSDRMEREDG